MTFFKQCETPCGCRDINGHLVYANDAYFRYFEISDERREYLLTAGTTWADIPPLTSVAEELAEHDRLAFETGQFHKGIGIAELSYTTRAFELVKFPLFIDGEKVATYFHLDDVRNTSGLYFLHREQFGQMVFERPHNRFTEREWEVLYMLYCHEKYADMAEFFDISLPAIKAKVASLKKKAQVQTTEELLKTGTEQGWHLYVPPRIVRDLIERYHLLLKNKGKI